MKKDSTFNVKSKLSLVLVRIIALSRSRLVKNVLVIEFNDMLQLSRRGDPLSRRWWRSPGAGARPASRRLQAGWPPWPAPPAAATPGSDTCCSSSQVSAVCRVSSVCHMKENIFVIFQPAHKDASLFLSLSLTRPFSRMPTHVGAFREFLWQSSSRRNAKT